MDLLKVNAFEKCLSDSDCSKYFTESKAQLLSYIFEALFKDYESLSEDDKDTNSESFTYMNDLAASDSAADEVEFYSSFYSVFVPLYIGVLEEKRDALAQQLHDKFMAYQEA